MGHVRADDEAILAVKKNPVIAIQNMKQMAVELIERAKTALASEKSKNAASEARLEKEHGILVRHDALLRRVEEAEAGVRMVCEKLEAFCGGDYVAEFGKQLSTDSSRLIALAPELASILAVKGLKTEILAAFRKETVDAAQASLAEFQLENKGVLAKYGALS